MNAEIILLKGSQGKKQYPVTSSEAVGMSDGTGNLDNKLRTKLDKDIYEAKIKELETRLKWSELNNPPRWFKDSLVCYYNPYKQYLSNDIIKNETNDKGYFILKDLSPNHLDMKCYGFAGEGMSGMDGYGTNFLIWGSNESGIITHKSEKKVKFQIEGDLKNKRIMSSSSSLKKGLTFAFKLINKNSESPCNFEYYDGKVMTKPVQNIELNKIYTVSLPESTFSMYFNLPLSKDGDSVEIEQIPMYENALVFDGVDDYGISENQPILNDYTLIIDKINISHNQHSAIASKRTSSSFGAFMLEKYSAGTAQVWSFGKVNPVSFKDSGICIMTPVSYNSEPIISGADVDTDKLTLGRGAIYNSECSSFAMYTFLLFNRTLSTKEIDWVKINIMNELPKKNA